jgi:rhodanese-related sulfurtransferase
LITHLSPKDFHAWASQMQTDCQAMPVLIDVREPWELNLAKVQPEGVELMCIPMQSIPQAAAHLDADRPTAILCHHGVRSMHVARYLESMGFTKLYNVSGGIDAWATQVDAKIGVY